jgi:hypothetical protein
MDLLSFALRIALAAVCLTASLGKARGRAAFRAFVTSVAQVARSVPLVRAPERFAAVVAGPTVGAELVVAALLPWPDTALAGTVLALLLFGALTAAVWIAAAAGVPARCACFGRLSRRLGPVHVARNLTLTAAAAVSCWLVASGAGAGPPLPGALVSAVSGVLFAAVVVRWEDLAALLVRTEVRS